MTVSTERIGTSSGSLPSWVILVIALVIIIADRITKVWAVANLTYGVPKRIAGEYLRFTLNWNQGAAMGSTLGSFSRVGFSLAAVVVLVMLAAFYRKGMQVALGLIGGGAVGNLFDRLTSARGVIDFIDVGVGSTRFWTFNIADSAVTCGAVLLAFTLTRHPTPTRAPVTASKK